MLDACMCARVRVSVINTIDQVNPRPVPIRRRPHDVRHGVKRYDETRDRPSRVWGAKPGARWVLFETKQKLFSNIHVQNGGLMGRHLPVHGLLSPAVDDH